MVDYITSSMYKYERSQLTEITFVISDKSRNRFGYEYDAHVHENTGNDQGKGTIRDVQSKVTLPIVPFPSMSTMEKAHLSFCSTVPEDVTFTAIRNSYDKQKTKTTAKKTPIRRDIDTLIRYTNTLLPRIQ